MTSPVNKNKLRVVCISDTHSKTKRMIHKIPYADVLIHAGDFTMYSSLAELVEFNEFLAELTYIKHKIISIETS